MSSFEEANAKRLNEKASKKILVDSITGPYGHELDVWYNEDTGGHIFVQDVGVPYEAVDTTLTSVFELRMIVEWLEGKRHVSA